MLGREFLREVWFTGGMPQLLAILASLVLGILALLHTALVFGAPFGRLVWGGRHRVLPAGLRVASALAVLGCIGSSIVMLSHVGLLSLVSGTWLVVTSWAVCGYFAIGVVRNALSKNKHERYTMSVVNLLLAVCALVVALSEYRVAQ